MRPYLALSGTIFGVVGVLHLLRTIYSWPVQIAGRDAPLWVSWVGLVVALALSLWGFLLWARAGQRGAL